MKVPGHKTCRRCGKYTRKHKHCQHEFGCDDLANFRVESLATNQSRRVCEKHVGHAISWLVIGPHQRTVIVKPTTPSIKPAPEPPSEEQG